MDAIDAIIVRHQGQETSPLNATRKAMAISLGAASCLTDERDKNIVRVL